MSSRASLPGSTIHYMFIILYYMVQGVYAVCITNSLDTVTVRFNFKQPRLGTMISGQLFPGQIKQSIFCSSSCVKTTREMGGNCIRDVCLADSSEKSHVISHFLNYRVNLLPILFCSTPPIVAGRSAARSDRGGTICESLTT